jgi:uncharacterized protein (DUF1499 family)
MQPAYDSMKTGWKMITPCPQTPNCVSSLDMDRRQFVEPFHFTGSAKDAMEKLVNIISDFKRARVVLVNENLIQAEFTSLFFRFVDDAEFFFDERKKIIHVKSASRIGYSDLGVNRRRIENIRKRFDKE